MDQIRGLLQQYVVDAGSGNTQDSSQDVHSDFDQVAQNAPQGQLADGIASAMRSDQTPDFGQMASQLFGQSNGQQKAGLLKHLMGAAGPGLVSQVLGQFGGGQLAGLLGGSGGQVTPDQADQVPQPAVQQIATHAEQQDPSIIDRVSELYSQHPDVVKSLGSKALSLIMSRMGQSL